MFIISPSFQVYYQSGHAVVVVIGPSGKCYQKQEVGGRLKGGAGRGKGKGPVTLTLCPPKTNPNWNCNLFFKRWRKQTVLKTHEYCNLIFHGIQSIIIYTCQSLNLINDSTYKMTTRRTENNGQHTETTHTVFYNIVIYETVISKYFQY